MPTPQTNPPAADMQAVLAQLQVMSRQMDVLVERQQRQAEFIQEMMPILKEVMAFATVRLGEMDTKGYFQFLKELGSVATRVMDNYTAQDVQQLGDAVVGILNTVKALTQPSVLAVANDAAKVLENAEKVEPLGIMGMVRATRNTDVQQGMAVLMEVLRHVGQAAQTLHTAHQESPAEQRKQRLAAITGSRKRALGTERTPAPRPVAAPRAAPPASPAPAAQPVVLDGVSFNADGHLTDPSQWTRALAESIAASQSVVMGPEHWRLVEFARADFEKTKVSPNIRRITQGANVATKDIYALFPKAPGRAIAKIAGLPKPAGCL